MGEKSGGASVLERATRATRVGAGPGERERRRRAGPSAGGKGAGPGERDGPREREGSGWVGLVSWAGFWVPFLFLLLFYF